MPSPQRHPSDVSPEYVALGFLGPAPLHGYELWQRFESALGQVWHISQSQMYLILKRLESQGLARSAAGTEGGTRGKRILSITEAGRLRLASWLTTPSDCNSRIIRLEFISRLFFALESDPESLPGMVAGQRAAIARHLENHRALLASLPRADRFNRLSIELRIRQLSATGLWLEKDVPALFG